MLDTSDQVGPLLEDVNSVPLDALEPSRAELFLHQKHHAVFKRLREEDPVHLTPDSPFGPFWSITKYDHIMEVDTDHQRFSSDPIITIGDHREDFVTPMFISMDPPEHDVQRLAVQKGVGPGRLKELEPLIRERQLLRRAEDVSGQTVGVHNVLAHLDGTPLPRRPARTVPDLRERNMQKRRDRIFAEARRMIAEGGYDALSTRALAKAAGVTQPTLYNLIGSKDEIVRELIIQTAERIDGIIRSIDVDDLERSIDVFTQSIVDVFAEDTQYYRAALIAVDRHIDLFADGEDRRNPRSIAAISISILQPMCESEIAKGNLRGNVRAEDLSAALFASFKANLRDWGHGVTTLETFSRRVRSAHYLTLASDAAPGLRKRLLQANKSLGPP